MELNNLSDELLDLIIARLGESSDGPYDSYRTNTDAVSPIAKLKNARLVCRRWERLASTHLWHTVTLAHAGEDFFDKWNTLLDRDDIRAIAREVVIHSSPDDLHEGLDWEAWRQWEQGSYPAFTDAISRIRHLPNLTAFRLRFTEHCRGERLYGSIFDDDYEKISTRLHTLRAAFEAIQQRASNSKNSTIACLRIDNLQNVPLPEFTSSELFKSVTKDITQLHLQVAEECNEHGPDHDIHCVERVQFEPYLHKSWLAPLADNLTDLTLYFRECWGVMPGVFNGKGLVFPHLKTLNLGYYTIAHHDQVDWIVAQTSLRHLRLDRCYIASHLRVKVDNMAKWKVEAYDWEEFPHGAFGFYYATDKCYYFPGTWQTVFDRFRTSLTRLTDFRFQIDKKHNMFFDNPKALSAELSPNRYIVFDIGLLPSQWIGVRGYGYGQPGEMAFGNNDPSIFDPTTGENRYKKRGSLNRSAETMEGDRGAFEALLEATHKRRLL